MPAVETRNRDAVRISGVNFLNAPTGAKLRTSLHHLQAALLKLRGTRCGGSGAKALCSRAQMCGSDLSHNGCFSDGGEKQKCLCQDFDAQ